MGTKFVKPAEGRNVRDPVTRKHIPAEGVEVPNDPFWRRRLRDGDVVEAPRPAERAQPKPRGKSEAKED